MRTVAYACPS
jgi:hypothetical protein